MEPAWVRKQNGISLAVMGKAFNVSHRTVWQWEKGIYFPREPLGSAYCRVIAGLARHLEVPEE